MESKLAAYQSELETKAIVISQLHKDIEDLQFMGFWAMLLATCLGVVIGMVIF